MNNASLPLEGVKVIELATVVAAPVAGRMLADYGAEVIKIETAPFGDPARIIGSNHSLPIENGNNPLFDQLNSGKRFISLNIKSEEGKEALFRLLNEADIFLTNVRMKSLRNMGIDYESIKDMFPELIYAHFSGLGLKGAEANKPCFDQTAFWTRSGSATDVLAKGSLPPSMSFGFGDIVSSSEFLNGIMMALFARTNTGRGTLVSTSLLKSAIWCSSVSAINSQEPYGVEYPIDRHRPRNPFAEFYRCSEGEWIGVFDRDYERNREYLAEILDMPMLVEDPDLVDLQSMRDADKIVLVTKTLEASFIKKPAEEWSKLLSARDIANEVAGHFANLYRDPQAVANGWFDEVDYNEGLTHMPTAPIDFSEYRRKEICRTGSMGCDTDAVLKEIGYSAEEIASMHENKSVQ